MRKPVLIEKLAECDGVRSVTIQGKNAVYYSVEALDNGEWVEVWNKTVKFTQAKLNRPGGLSFQTAALEQEAELREAKKLVA